MQSENSSINEEKALVRLRWPAHCFSGAWDWISPQGTRGDLGEAALCHSCSAPGSRTFLDSCSAQVFGQSGLSPVQLKFPRKNSLPTGPRARGAATMFQSADELGASTVSTSPPSLAAEQMAACPGWVARVDSQQQRMLSVSLPPLSLSA